MEDEEIAEKIHYPDCWDTEKYPTVASALWYITQWFPEHLQCEVCGESLTKEVYGWDIDDR